MNTDCFGQPLDHALITEVLTAVNAARDRLNSIPRVVQTIPEIHSTLRILAGATPDIDTLENPILDLADLIHALLRNYANALTTLQALAVEPVDPTSEYERLIRAAEKELTGLTGRSDSAARAEALVKIADRWLSDAIVQAHKRRTGATRPAEALPTTADIERAYEAAKAVCPEWNISEHIAFEAGWKARENWI